MAGALPIGWLFGQSDYLLFADGIALAMLAAVGLARGRRVRSTPWLGLALFGTLASLGRAAMLMAQASTRYADLAAIGVLLECLAALLLLPCVYARARLAPGLLWAGTLAPAGVALVVAFSPIRCDVDVLAQACLPWLACNWAAVAMLGTTRRVREPVPWRMRTAALMLVLYGVAVALPALARHTLAAPVPGVWLPLLAARPLLMVANVWLLGSGPAEGGRWRPSFIDWGLVAGLLILAGSFVLVNLAGRNEYADQRQGLLRRAQAVAGALSPAWTGMLRGMPQDESEQAPAYVQMCARLRGIQRASPDVRFVYLMRREGARILFLADSEPLGSADHSPPGQVYDEASAEFRTMFDTGEPLLEGPVVDRWGRWLSASVAIRDAAGQRILAVLGMDVDARQVDAAVAWHRLLAIWLAQLLSLLVLGLFVGLHANRLAMLAASVSERRFRAVFEGAPEPVFLFDAGTGRVSLANPAFCAWLGYGAEEITKLSVPELVGVPLAKIRSQLLAAPRHLEEWTFRRRDGTGALAETAGAELSVHDDLRIVAFVRDITVRKQNEVERQKALAALERFNRLMVGREIRVLELKREVNALLQERHRPPAYASVETTAAGAAGGAPHKEG